MPGFGFGAAGLGPCGVVPAVAAGVGGEPVEGRAGAGVDAAAAADVDGFAPAVVGGAGVGAQAALFQAALDLFVVGAVAVGDADVLPDGGLERGVELVERGRGVAFELQGRRGGDRAECVGRDPPVLV